MKFYRYVSNEYATGGLEKAEDIFQSEDTFKKVFNGKGA